jgi:hypothetical protein
MITICINDNNAVINSHYERLQDFILLFKIPMATQENFFEIYKKFGHAPSKWLSIPGLYVIYRNKCSTSLRLRNSIFCTQSAPSLSTRQTEQWLFFSQRLLTGFFTLDEFGSQHSRNEIVNIMQG